MKINKKMQMSRNKRKASQALCEYFLILLVLAGLTILGVTTILPKIKTAGGEYAQDAIDEIAGDVVLVEEVEFPSNLDGVQIWGGYVHPLDGEYPLFKNLMKNVTIKIYNGVPDLVFEASPTLTKPEWTWNCRNNSGDLVASGTYKCKVSGGGYEVSGFDNKNLRIIVVK